MLLRAKVDLLYRRKLKELFYRDPIFAFNAFFYTYDPRKRPFHHIPFATYDYEDEMILQLVKCIKEGEDCLIEKSRDMGVSWTVIGVFMWLWEQPIGGNDFLVGSRIEDYVDRKGDMRTLFAKARYIHQRLPRWLWPEGFLTRRDDNYMKLINPESGSVFAGESNNANFSTGGRYAGILFDEFAKWESTDESAWTAAGDASPCRIPVSTPFGAGGQYYLLAHGGAVRKLRYHWTRHPDKSKSMYCVYPPPNAEDKGKFSGWVAEEKIQSPWYDREVERRTPSEVAQELDIDYLGSGNPIFEGRAWRALQYYFAKGAQPNGYRALKLESLSSEPVSEPLSTEGYLVIYEEPVPLLQYVWAADVVEGVEGGDFAVVKVLCRETKNIVASYFANLDEVNLAKVIRIITAYYNLSGQDIDTPWGAPETTGPGLATFDILAASGLINLFMAPRYDVSKGGVSFKKGWRTDTNSRNELVAGIRAYLEDRAGDYLDPRLCGELMTFVRSKTGKPQAKSGCHDDEVMTLGMVLQIDQIAPYVPKVLPERLRADGLPLNVLLPETAPEVKEPTNEELCLAQILAKKSIVNQEKEFWETRGELMELAMGEGADDFY